MLFSRGKAFSAWMSDPLLARASLAHQAKNPVYMKLWQSTLVIVDGLTHPAKLTKHTLQETALTCQTVLEGLHSAR